jgi:hypothetical protein
MVRSIELYLKSGGDFAFVMPFATLSRRQFAGLRAADYPAKAEPVTVAFSTPWDLKDVRPHPFPVPCSVVLGTRTTNQARKPMPAETVKWTGNLPERNVDWAVAEEHLSHKTGTIAVPSGEHASPYARRFESGAKLNPQVLVVVVGAATGPLGAPSGYRSVKSIPSTQETWRDVQPLQGTLEAEFVRPLHLSSTIFPFRPGEPRLAVVPWDMTMKRLLNANDDALDRYPRLAEWWRRASELWNQHGTPENYDLTGRIDYQRKLSRQFPIASNRIVYTASGSRLTAARLADGTSIASHKLYWATTASPDEAHYLTAVLNTRVVTDRVAPYQSSGQYGTRDFDKYVWYVPVPEYSPTIAKHGQLATLGRRAEEIAANVELPSGIGFQSARRRIRQALEDDGVAEEMEQLVAELIPSSHGSGQA